MNMEQLKSRLNSKVESITQERKLETMNDNALITEQGYIALKDNTIDIIKQNLKNQPLSFQLFVTVKAPSGGSTVFTVPAFQEMKLKNLSRE